MVRLVRMVSWGKVLIISDHNLILEIDVSPSSGFSSHFQ